MAMKENLEDWKEWQRSLERLAVSMYGIPASMLNPEEKPVDKAIPRIGDRVRCRLTPDQWWDVKVIEIDEERGVARLLSDDKRFNWVVTVEQLKGPDYEWAPRRLVHLVDKGGYFALETS